MEIDDHYALRTGFAPLPQGKRATLSVQDLGILRVPSGMLGACDPFVYLDESVIVPIPPGDYPVRVTIADVSTDQDGSHLREAYLSVVLSAAESRLVVPASGPNGPPPTDQFFGVGVDAGTVAFVDAEAVLRCMPEDTSSWYDQVFDSGNPDSWFSVMDSDAPHIRGAANLVMPRAALGENVVLTHSGWGDGFYPLLETRSSDGWLTGIHIDLQVVGLFEEDLQDVSATQPQEKLKSSKNWLTRLLGR
ncbi:MAG: DUF4241 domain-containing protein [Kineosporiaceae bacterium]|nr:DUF4241 domain-containing protein [Aeromicrobium sp.]